MEDFLKNNWFKLGIILSLVFFVYIYNKNAYVLELYKINSDCSEKAQEFAKSKSDEIDLWVVSQSLFNKSKESCFAEFVTTGVVDNGSYYIYDLTHDKNLAYHPGLGFKWDTNTYSHYMTIYNKVSSDIFGK